MTGNELGGPKGTGGKAGLPENRGEAAADGSCCGDTAAPPTANAGFERGRIEVFEPAMCCATGVCGSSVDPRLVRFAGALEWLESRGVGVARHNLSQDPASFAGNTVIREQLAAKGPDCLPIVLVNGRVTWEAEYPTRMELAQALSIEESSPTRIYSESVEELVALGAAIAANCEPCFRSHYDAARKLGISKEDMLAAVETARAVRDSPAQSILRLAGRYLGTDTADPPSADGVESTPLPMAGSRKCC